MPRQARLIVPEVALHVVQRGHNRQACFRQHTDYLVYLTTLAELSVETGCALHAYCLMTNHVHLLLTPSAPQSCAKLMRGLGQQYVQYVNRRYERTGTLWEGRFRSCLVESSEYVLACHRYIERNPVRARMVPSAALYPWSSHSANAGRVENKFLTPHSEYTALSADPSFRHAAYQQLVEDGDKSEFLDAIRDATNGGFALVGDQLKAQVEGNTGRHLARRKPGPAATKETQEPDLLSYGLGLRPRIS